MGYDRQLADLLRTERARRIHERLLVVGDGPASFYLRVLDELRADTGRPAARNTVFHAWRELESSLREVLAPLVPAEAEIDTHEKTVIGVLRALGIALDDPVARTWLGLVGRPHREAHRAGLQASGPIDDALRTDWDAFEDVLDRVLARFEERYLDAVAGVPRLIATAAPSEDDVVTLARLPQGPALSTFFNGVEHEGWLAPLARKGLFLRPVARAYAADGSFKMPFWPPAGYLHRLAQRGSERLQMQAMEVVLATSETDNDILHVEFTEIALLAPPLMVAAWAERETEWLKGQVWIHPLLGERLAQLAAALADAGATEIARSLAAALLEPLPDPRFTDGDERTTSLGKEPRTRLGEDFDYEHVLEIIRPALRSALGRETVAFVADLLDRAVSLGRVVDTEDGRDDLSTWWRATIDDTDQTLAHGTAGSS